jgi:L-threonylcarbamoyladenylate synthase
MVRIDARDPEASGIDRVVGILADGGVVCFPTDTAYGLGVDPGNRGAVEKLFRLKGRDADQPILLLIDSIEMGARVARLGDRFGDIAKRFWPGPLTLVVPALPTLSTRVTAGSGTVGIRWPDARFALRLIGACGHPLTATSANRSGQPIADTVDDAIAQLGPDLDATADAGSLSGATPSTVLDLTSNPARILREGPIRAEDLASVLEVAAAQDQTA